MKVLKIVIMNNWRSYFFPLFMSVYIPVLAYSFNQLTFFVLFGTVVTIVSCVMGMIDRDIGKSFYTVAKAQNEAIVMIHDEIQKARKEEQNRAHH